MSRKKKCYIFLIKNKPPEYFQNRFSVVVHSRTRGQAHGVSGPGGKPRSRAPEFCSPSYCVILGRSLNVSGLQWSLSGTGMGLKVLIPPFVLHEVARKR